MTAEDFEKVPGWAWVGVVAATGLVGAVVAKILSKLLIYLVDERFKQLDSADKAIEALQAENLVLRKRLSDQGEQLRYTRFKLYGIEKKIGGVPPLSLEEETSLLRNEQTKEHLLDTPGPKGRKR